MVVGSMRLSLRFMQLGFQMKVLIATTYDGHELDFLPKTQLLVHTNSLLSANSNT
nr:MAG TPA: hypothetical protein [Caudoviricetes sp.]